MPNIQLNMVAVIVAVVASFIFGFIWYTPLFGKAWARELKFDLNEKPKSPELIKGMLLNLVGVFLLVWVMGHDLLAWRPETWGVEDKWNLTPLNEAFFNALYTWLGFFLPSDLSRVAWERGSWKLFFINTGYHFLNLLLVATILVYML